MKEDIDFLADNLFDYLDLDGYLLIIKMTNGKIPGFTAKNYHKVPEPIAKNVAKKLLKKMKNAKNFLKQYTKEMHATYKDLLFEDFIMKANLDQKLTDGKKLAFLYLNYPDEFEAEGDTIKQNLEQGNPVFQHVIQPSLYTKLKALTNRKRSTEKVKKLANISIDEAPEHSLVDILKQETLPYPGNSYYMKLYATHQEEWNALDHEERAVLYQLVIEDLIMHDEKKLVASEATEAALREKLEKQGKQLELKKEQVDEMKEKLYDREGELKQIKGEYKTSQQELEAQKKSYDELEANRVRLEDNYVQLQESYEELKEKTIELSKNPLFADLEFYMFMKENSAFTQFFSGEQMINFKDVTDLKDILEHRQIDRETIYFINMDGISTRESFQLEKLLKEKAIEYRIVSGGSSSIVRKIIHYLEGELRHEVKRKN